jgi:glycerol uptake facilitator protein/aquaporin Z
MYCVVAQLLGSVLGVMVARLVWRPVVAESSVAYAVLQPGPGWSWVTLFVGETVNMAIIVLTVVIC